MMNITHDDANLLTRITKSLVANLESIIGPDAEAKFRKHASAGDIARLFKAKLSLEFNARSADARKKAQANINLNNAALEPLLRAFGEDTLLKALPNEAASQHVIDLCEELGASKIADLCRKKMAQISAAPAAPQLVKPAI